MGPDQWRRSVAQSFDVWVDFDARACFLLPVIIRDGCWVHPRRTAALAGRRHNVHRLAYAMFIGPVDQGQKVTSACACEGCCRPDHLVLRVKHAKNAVKSRAVEQN